VIASLEHIATGVGNAARGWTRAFWSTNEIARLGDFCFSNSAIQFISRGILSIQSFQTATNFSIPVFPTTIETLKIQIKTPVFHWPVIFISAAPTEPWRQLTDVLFPVWITIAGSTLRNESSAVLLRPNLQKHLIAGIQRIVNVKTINAGCFAAGEFPRTPGAIPFGGLSEITLADHLLWMGSESKMLHNFCQELAGDVKVVRYRIVIDRFGGFLLNCICRMFPNANVLILPETNDIIVLARIVASCHVFVACHVSAVMLGMFAKGAVVEVQPDGFECVAFGKLWTPVGGAVYIPLKTGGRCNCTNSNLSHYLEALKVWENVDEETLRHAILDGFQIIIGE
jgi:hypothetical protein